MKTIASIICAICAICGTLRARDITLQWDPSPSPSIVAYAVFWYPTNTTLTDAVVTNLMPMYRTNVGNTLSVKWNLTNDTVFWAIAIDSTGLESDLSNPAYAKLVLPPKLRKITYTTTVSITAQ